MITKLFQQAVCPTSTLVSGPCFKGAMLMPQLARVVAALVLWDMIWATCCRIGWSKKFAAEMLPNVFAEMLHDKLHP